MQLNTVGLPGTFGRSTHGRAARGDEGQIVHRHQAAEPHGEMLDREQGLGVHQGFSSTRLRPFWVAPAAIAWRSLRKSDGARAEISPRGRHTMMATMAKPNTSMRYCVGSKSGPNTALRTSSSRKSSVPPITTMAAIATPTWLPRPPSTTMARIVADSRKVKDSGEMKP